MAVLLSACSTSETTLDDTTKIESSKEESSTESGQTTDLSESSIDDKKEATEADSDVIWGVSDFTNEIPFEAHGKLCLNGTKIVDASGNPFQIKGVSTHGIAWFPQYVNYDAFATLRDDWGVNCIRLAMYSDESSGYCSGGDRERLKNLVVNGVNYATELGMYVIIDWHVLGEHDPNVHKDEAKVFFDEMSKLYADYDNVLYEICNEPNGNVNWEDVKRYAEDVIPVIRANSPDSLIIIGTPTWSQDVDIASKSPITGYDNLLYTIHFYADTHRQDLRNKVKTAIDNGLPLFCSEFGICDASGNGNNNRDEADKWIQLFDDNGISYCIWNLSNKNESSSLIKASCIKTSGWAYEDLSDEGQWYVDTIGKKHGSLIGEPSNQSSGGQTDSQTSDKSADNQTDSQTSDSVSSSVSGNLSVNLVSDNSWNDGSNEFCQYAISITNSDNTSGANGWKVLLEFDTDVELDQSWNGTYKVFGKSILITPVDYNSEIGKNSSISDIGFIIKSNKSAKLVKVSIS